MIFFTDYSLLSSLILYEFQGALEVIEELVEIDENGGYLRVVKICHEFYKVIIFNYRNRHDKY